MLNPKITKREMIAIIMMNTFPLPPMKEKFTSGQSRDQLELSTNVNIPGISNFSEMFKKDLEKISSYFEFKFSEFIKNWEDNF